jgi:hypothetical protein
MIEVLLFIGLLCFDIGDIGVESLRLGDISPFFLGNEDCN